MPNWTDGLSTRAANALRGHGGYNSKKEVYEAFVRGEIQIKTKGGGGFIENIGKKTLIEIRVWLGLQPDNPPSEAVLKWVIKYCEDNGYAVTTKNQSIK